MQRITGVSVQCEERQLAYCKSPSTPLHQRRSPADSHRQSHDEQIPRRRTSHETMGAQYAPPGMRAACSCLWRTAGTSLTIGFYGQVPVHNSLALVAC